LDDAGASRNLGRLEKMLVLLGPDQLRTETMTFHLLRLGSAKALTKACDCGPAVEPEDFSLFYMT